MNYFVIGEREIVLAFNLVGVSGTIAETRQEALDAFNRITGKVGISSSIEETPRVLILTETVASFIQEEELAWQKSSRYPLLVEVPGLDGHIEGRKTLTESIEEAIGIKI